MCIGSQGYHPRCRWQIRSQPKRRGRQRHQQRWAFCFKTAWQTNVGCALCKKRWESLRTKSVPVKCSFCHNWHSVNCVKVATKVNLSQPLAVLNTKKIKLNAIKVATEQKGRSKKRKETKMSSSTVHQSPTTHQPKADVNMTPNGELTTRDYSRQTNQDDPIWRIQTIKWR